MRCPYCGSEDTQVKDSRPSEDNTSIRRRRVCTDCGGRFTTFERVQLRELMVAKKSGRRVPFDRDKLMRSVQVALRKRPVDPERVERMVNGVVRQLESLGENEIQSEQIGVLVMEGLKGLDDVAYVRFALANPALFRLTFSATAARNILEAPEHVPDAMAFLRRNAEAAAAHFGGDPRVIAIRAWSIAHGLATLILEQQIEADDALIERVISAVPVDMPLPPASPGTPSFPATGSST